MTTGPTALIAHHDQLAVEVLSAACRRRGVLVLGRPSTLEDLPALYTSRQPDVVVCADRFADRPVDTVLAELIADGARVIVLTAEPASARMVSLLAQGAMGGCAYEAAPAEIADAIVTVADGAAALTPTVARSLLEEWRRTRRQTARQPSLTPREREIVAAMAEGLSGKGIAARLGVTRKTVENHKIRVFEKLGVRTQAHAVSVALATGLAVS